MTMSDKFRERWTDERQALLAEMKSRGPKVIWEAVNKLPGPPVTKAAVIGLRDRRFMARKPKKTPEEIAALRRAKRDRENAAVRVRRAKAKESVNFNRVEVAKHRIDPEPYICREVPDVAPLNLSLMDLQDGDCRWPYDAPAGAEVSFVFCGHPAIEGKPYCLSHCALAFNGIPVAKRTPYLDIGKHHGGAFGRVA